MSKTKEYQVCDLFYTAWKDLDDRKHIRVYTQYLLAQSLGLEHDQYGYVLISILRTLRKNARLVDKLNLLQAVDIFNDLKFLSEPWDYFPTLNNDLLVGKPDPSMARCSFDQFIYADNEFTSFLATDSDHERFLRRLAVTLYKPAGEIVFDKETVESRELLIKNVPLELLQLVFFTFGHIRNTLTNKRCKTLLQPGPKGNKTKPCPSGSMWYNIKHQAAKTLVFGDFENVGRTNMYYVLDHLEILLKEKEEKRG